MTPSTIDARSTLDRLIETNKDSVLLFRAAADTVDRESLRVLFLHFVQQRAAFADALQRHVRAGDQGGGEAVSLSATLHVGWMQLRAAWADREERALIAECLRSEAAALRAYEEALRAELPAVVRARIERQYERIKNSHLRLRTLNEDYAVKDGSSPR